MILLSTLQMVIHAGGNTTSKKVAEYGGNTFGFGSRSVLGSGWPKDLVRVSNYNIRFLLLICAFWHFLSKLFAFIIS